MYSNRRVHRPTAQTGQPPKKSKFPLSLCIPIIKSTTTILLLNTSFLTLFLSTNIPVQKNHYPEFKGEPKELADTVYLKMAFNA
jgi:hypothetical protein